MTARIEDEAGAVGAVAELQGLYGPFHFPELTLQRLWAERAFDVNAARTLDGLPLKIVSAGRWNRLGGPDFRRARIKIGEHWREGDVEVHLHEPDWSHHGHANDRHYDDVILHVVLFPPRKGAPTTTPGARGRPIPVVVMLPLLWHDLEEYVADDALARIAARPADRIAATWRDLPAEEVDRRLTAAANRRWRTKVYYAGRRIERLGWEAACHHTALEVLGYRFNRVGMLKVATRWPLPYWATGTSKPDELYDILRESGDWHLQAIRPANHPRRRLQAYAGWARDCPDWPERLRQWAQQWTSDATAFVATSASEGVAVARRHCELARTRREAIAQLGIGHWVKRPRADNLWGDGLLPLAAAAQPTAEARLRMWWLVGWPGDQPTGVREMLRTLGVTDGRANPLSWGAVQGLLGTEAQGQGGRT